MEKKCSKCGEWKDIDLFSLQKSKKDGHRSWCKECIKEPNKIYRQKNKDKIKQYFEDYVKKYKDRIIERAKSYYKKNSDTILKKNKSYRKTKRGKDVDRGISKRQYDKWPEKQQARNAVYHAVVTGKLPNIKTLSCSICIERQADHYHHHNGYDYIHRLDVIPVCVKCHLVIEKEHKNRP